MSFFTKVFGWLSKQETSIEKVLTRIEPYLPQAETIVTTLSAITTGIASTDHTTILGTVAKYLGTTVADTGKVAAFLAAHTGSSAAVILRDAAVMLLGLIPGASTLVSDLNLAIELAYSVTKQNALTKVN